MNRDTNTTYVPYLYPSLADGRYFCDFWDLPTTKWSGDELRLNSTLLYSRYGVRIYEHPTHGDEGHPLAYVEGERMVFVVRDYNREDRDAVAWCLSQWAVLLDLRERGIDDVDNKWFRATVREGQLQRERTYDREFWWLCARGSVQTTVRKLAQDIVDFRNRGDMDEAEEILRRLQQVSLNTNESYHTAALHLSQFLQLGGAA
jgi:hypothetical protein